ncbi:MAG TPA: MogA/MoaB family molybdenum cofactor biosynthesis protein [Candidatus Polarisedimenticolaceae bacterium]|nr:MogA/MoaB family molybdenum cofactor biosynthesis protein [Candidatus Polarisedimenticolaceae bacterium]
MTSEHARHGALRAAIGLLTVSDTRTEATDASGAEARRLLTEAGHAIAGYAILPDEPEKVAAQVKAWLGSSEIEAVVVHGGTGVSKRDRTFEALAGQIERPLPGFGELFRMLSFEEVGAAAMLSRATAGVASGKPLFVLPGSTKAVTLALSKLILPALPHLLGELRR